MFSGWCWIGDGEPGTKLGKASATTHFGPHRGGGLMMTADLSTRRRHHPSLSLEFGVVGGRLSSIQLQTFSVSPDPLYLDWALPSHSIIALSRPRSHRPMGSAARLRPTPILLSRWRIRDTFHRRTRSRKSETSCPKPH